MIWILVFENVFSCITIKHNTPKLCSISFLSNKIIEHSIQILIINNTLSYPRTERDEEPISTSTNLHV